MKIFSLNASLKTPNCRWLGLLVLLLWNPASGAETRIVRPELSAAVVSNYCNLVHAAYADSLQGVRDFQSAVETFLAQPDAQTLRAARQAWNRSRTVYLQTEIARFYDGPIEAVEGQVNSWPIDENYIDYTVDEPHAGLINLPEKFPALTRDVLAGANEKGGEKNISTGFHAIEFLLWGQDLSETGPGDRPPSDYAEDAAGLAHNSPRRREYFRCATALLVEHLAQVEREWQPGLTNNYRAQFLALPPAAALAHIFKGLGSYSSGELGGERLLVPYATKEQEGEHSCFSDTTHLDFIHGQLGIQNIFLGRYLRADGSRISGPGLKALLETADPQLAATLESQIAASLAAFEAVPPPFDQAMLGRDTDPGRVAIKRSIDAMQAQTLTIAKAAKALGIRLNLK